MSPSSEKGLHEDEFICPGGGFFCRGMRDDVSKYLADKILTSRSSIEGERKPVTVLFADVADYRVTAKKCNLDNIKSFLI